MDSTSISVTFQSLRLWLLYTLCLVTSLVSTSSPLACDCVPIQFEPAHVKSLAPQSQTPSPESSEFLLCTAAFENTFSLFEMRPICNISLIFHPVWQITHSFQIKSLPYFKACHNKKSLRRSSMIRHGPSISCIQSKNVPVDSLPIRNMKWRHANWCTVL